MVERMADCRSIDLFILGEAWFFSAFHCWEDKASLHAVVHLDGCNRVKNVCEKNVSSHEISCLPRENKGLGNLYNFVRKKKIPRKAINQLSISEVKIVGEADLAWERDI